MIGLEGWKSQRSSRHLCKILKVELRKFFQGAWGSRWKIWGVVRQPETWRKTSPERSPNFPLANVIHILAMFWNNLQHSVLAKYPWIVRLVNHSERTKYKNIPCGFSQILPCIRPTLIYIHIPPIHLNLEFISMPHISPPFLRSFVLNFSLSPKTLAVIHYSVFRGKENRVFVLGWSADCRL